MESQKQKLSTTFVLFCRGCNLRTKNYDKVWRPHLLEETHQEHAREMMRSMHAKNKSVVIFGTLSIKEKTLLKYFGDLALAVDFVFWKIRPTFCIVTFLSSHFLKEVLKTKEHTIQNKKLFLRNLNEISEAEWLSICPFAAVQPMEVDLGGGFGGLIWRTPEGNSPEDPFNNSESEEDEISEEDEPLELSPQRLNHSPSTSAGISFADVFEKPEERALNNDKEFENEILNFPEKIASDAYEPISEDEKPSTISSPIPTSTTANNGTVAGRSSRPKLNIVKLKKFSIELELKHKESDKLKQWLDLFQLFNSRVWPISFKVMLYDLENDERIPDKPWRQLVQPFRGVIMNSGNLDWAHSKYQAKGKMTKELKIIFDEMYNRLNDNTFKVPLRRNSPTDEDLKGKAFLFDCKVFGKAVKSNGSISMKFTNIRVHGTASMSTSPKTFKNHIINMYEKLWSSYYRSRLSIK